MTKASSRAGRFKKKLVNADQLKLEAPLIRPKLTLLQDQLSGADFVAAYIITYLAHRFPGSWPGAKHSHTKMSGTPWRKLGLNLEPNIEKRLSDTETIQEIFLNFALKSTPQSVNRAILEWSKQRYALVHMTRIPSPFEVLEQQKLGRRCVTTITDHRMDQYILGERDALSFTMHDLIHADHFYHHNDCYRGQLGFYGLLSKTFSYFDLSHEKFAFEFEYLIADMNAYAIHLLKCLKSAMIHYFSEEYFRGWAQELSPPESIYELNTPNYKHNWDQELLDWLDQYRTISLGDKLS